MTAPRGGFRQLALRVRGNLLSRSSKEVTTYTIHPWAYTSLAVTTTLQEGRVYHLLAPWPLDGNARWCDACALASANASDESCSYCGGPTRMRPLTSITFDLATARSTRIEFVRGENAKNLREEFGGLAGLVRF